MLHINHKTIFHFDMVRDNKMEQLEINLSYNNQFFPFLYTSCGNDYRHNSSDFPFAAAKQVESFAGELCMLWSEMTIKPLRCGYWLGNIAIVIAL